MRLYIKEKIDAAHQLYLPNISEEENERRFGKCKNLHGHSWVVEVWLEGEVDSDTGMVVNFVEVKKLIRSFDHKCLNDVVGFLPTAENLALHLAYSIRDLKNVENVKVRVWESEKAYAEVEL